jgi:hypothetical protein
MFLPFIGFALVLQHLGRLSLSGMKRAGHGLLATVTPTWRPGESYFAGKEGEKRQAKEEAAEEVAKDAGPDEPKAN